MTALRLLSLALLLVVAAARPQAIGITNGSHSVNTLRYGGGAPSSSLGNDGDFYIDNTNWVIYGPRLNGAWPAGVAISSGATGSAGETPTFTIGSVTTLSPGASATATLSGGPTPYTLNFGIPAGATGASGSGTGTVNTGTGGQFAYYSATGTTLSGHTLAAGDIPALGYAAPGTCPSGQYASATTTSGVTCSTPSGSGGSSAFGSLTSGVNTSANMIVGSGATMQASGSGAIVATGLAASVLTGSAGTKVTSALAAGTSGDCVKWLSTGDLGDAGAPCGSGSGGGVSTPGTTTVGNVPQYSNTSGSALSTGLGVVTTVGSPGSNTNVATEAAIRTAINAASTSSGALPSYTGTAGYLTTNGSAAAWGDITTGPSGALCAGTGCPGGTAGIVDIITSVVPRVAAANTFTGYDLFAQPVGMAQQSSGTIPATGKDNLYMDTGDNLHIVNSSGVDTSLGGGRSTVLQASTIVTEGDSITAGYEANGVSGGTGTSYAALVSTDAKTTLVNHAVGGYFACDEAELEAIPGDLSTIDANSLYTLMIGTNDANNHTTSDGYSTTFNLCHQAAMAWIAASNKFAANGTNCTDTGTWSAWPGAGDGTPQLIGEYTTQSGATKSCPITTTGGPIYAWYWMQSPNSGAGTYSVDGGTAVAFTTAPAVTISAKGSSKYGWGLIRVPVAAGSHTILFTNTTSGSGIVLSAIGTTSPAPMYQQPHLFVAGVIKQDGDTNSAVTAYYDSLVKANVSLLAGDGLNITYVPVRNYVCTVVTGGHCYSNYATPVQDINSFGSDILHPNAQGHLELKRAFEDAMQFTPYSSGSGGGSGTVNAGTSGQFAYYSSSGTAVSGHSLTASDVNGLGTLSNATTGNAATATALAATPTTCSAGQAPTGILANGNATGCASIGSGGGSMVYPGAGVANSTGSAWGTSYTVGSAANNLVQLNSSAQLPAVSGVNLTALPATAVVTGSASGNGTKYASVVTAGASGNCAKWDANGNVADAGAACGSGGGTVTDASLPTDQCVLQTPVTISYSSLTGAASATPTYTLSTLALPSTSTRICLVEITGTTQFAGTSITAGTVRLQSGASTPQLYSPNQDILTNAVGPTTNNFWSDSGNMADRTNSSIVAAFTFTGGTSAALTAGAVKITVGFRTMP